MASLRALTLLLSLLSLFIASSASSLHQEHESTPDVHDLLPLYGLPKGLLPRNVKSYKLSANGDFEIELNSHCYVQFDRLVYYERKISGKLSYGAVRDVEGIQAKKLFVWVPVTAIERHRNSDVIKFFWGFVSEELPVKLFEKIPACGSGVTGASNSVVASI